jgi:HTH-type transcriptional regulator / antitoxin HipB
MEEKEESEVAPFPDARALGQFMRRRRRALGLTQQRLADLSGVSHKFINQVEGGKETAEIGKVLRVMQRLGIDVMGRVR